MQYIHKLFVVVLSLEILILPVALIKAEAAKWSAVVRTANIKPE
jgi:hypothetical protein